MHRSNYCPISLYIAIALAVLASGCSPNRMIDSDMRMNIRTNQDGKISRIYDTFTGFERESLETEKGQTISFDYEATISKGSLIIEWQDPKGAITWRKVLLESESGKDDIVILSPGTYTIVIQGEEASGDFCVSWDIEQSSDGGQSCQRK